MITELSFSQQSRLFAQLSMLAYLPKQEAAPLFAAEGLSATLYTNQHSTAYLLECEDDLVLVFRGTIYQDFNTVKVNFKVSKVPASIGCGHKHRGFKEAVDSLWPQLKPCLQAAGRQRKIWFAGHSLGAALGTIAAIRCKHDPDLPDPEALFTFGSPRVGTAPYIGSLWAKQVVHYRWVNSVDLVTMLPSTWWGYRHHGTLYYLDHTGNQRSFDSWQRFKDRLRGVLRGLWTSRLWFANSHDPRRYVELLTRRDAGRELSQSGSCAGLSRD